MAEPFTLFKRNEVYYARFRNADGTRTAPRSTGCKRKKDAQSWATEQLKQERLSKPSGKKTFAEYAEPWWDNDTCFYVRRRRSEGHELSETYLAANRGLVKNHLVPTFGKTPLEKITRKSIEAWKIKLFESKKISAATINHALKVLKLMLQEAYRDEIIVGNPAGLVSQVKGNSEERVSLTLEEAQKVLIDPEKWRDFRHYVLNLVAFTTGARLGELQALTWQYVFETYIRIEHGWERKTKTLKDPKWRSVRSIPIPRYTSERLTELKKQTPYGEPTDFVFATANRNTPLEAHEVNNHLKAVLKAAEISKKFTFHGWRHTYVTLLRTNVDDITLRHLTRHKSDAMVERYTHLDGATLTKVTQAQKEWFAG